MNDEELAKVFKVLSHCDNGCNKCVKNIFYYFGTVFPEYAEKAIEFYQGDWEWWEPRDPNKVYKIPDILLSEIYINREINQHVLQAQNNSEMVRKM